MFRHPLVDLPPSKQPTQLEMTAAHYEANQLDKRADVLEDEAARLREQAEKLRYKFS